MGMRERKVKRNSDPSIQSVQAVAVELLWDRLGVKAPTDVGLPVISQSAVHADEYCPTYGAIRRLGLRKKGRSSGADEGSYTHIALRTILKYFHDPKKGYSKAYKYLKRAYKAMLADSIRLSGREEANEQFRNKATQDMNVGFSLANRLFNELASHVKRKTVKIIAREVQFSVTLRLGLPSGTVSEPFIVEGTIDVIVQDKEGGYHFGDFKTTAALPSRFILHLDYALQKEIYTRGVRAILAGAPINEHRVDARSIAILKSLRGKWIEGFLYFIIMKPGITRKGLHTDNPQTVKDYVREVDEWFDGTGRHKRRKAEAQAEPPIRVWKSAVAENWPADIAMRVQRSLGLRRLPMTQTNFPRSDGRCLFGRSECMAYNVCTASAQRVKDIVKRDFTLAPDPLGSGHHAPKSELRKRKGASRK